MGNTLITKNDLDRARDALGKYGPLDISDEQLAASLIEMANYYGLTVAQFVKYVGDGAPRHSDAPAHHCGVADPRDNGKWCVRHPDHVDRKGDSHHQSHPSAEGS